MASSNLEKVEERGGWQQQHGKILQLSTFVVAAAGQKPTWRLVA